MPQVQPVSAEIKALKQGNAISDPLDPDIKFVMDDERWRLDGMVNSITDPVIKARAWMCMARATGERMFLEAIRTEGYGSIKALEDRVVVIEQARELAEIMGW